MSAPNATRAAACSPLVLADRLIGLAQDADRAGFTISARRLIAAAYAVLDDNAFAGVC